MKIIRDIIIAAIMILAAWLIGGCTQIVLEKDRLKINTFLKSVEFDSFYYDPNDGFFQVDKYTGIPSNIELEYDPITRSFKIKAVTPAASRITE